MQVCRYLETCKNLLQMEYNLLVILRLASNENDVLLDNCKCVVNTIILRTSGLNWKCFMYCLMICRVITLEY